MESKEQTRDHHFLMIASWQQSGQSQKQFCLQNNIAYHVFHYWYKIYRDQQPASSGSFVALGIASQYQANVEVHLTDGRRIVFNQPVSADFLKALIAWVMLHLSASGKYYFYTQPVDMRKGFDSLSGLVQQHMQLNILNGGIFIFINKKRNQVKLLLWEGDGLSLYYKRLEQGTYDCPQLTEGYHLSATQLQLILQGIQLKSVKMKKRYQHAVGK